MIWAWVLGVMRVRGYAVLAAMLGVGVAVALMALLGLFIDGSAASMTARAVASVAPDWQVELQGTTDPESAVAAVTETSKDARIQIVSYADVAGLEANIGGTTQTTGAGKVIGLDPDYRLTFPYQLRLLAGSFDGPLLAQQTAANLRAAPGDEITVTRLGEPNIRLKVSGIVDMADADQFFQIIGANKQSAPTAPPDNVVLLDGAKWQELFETQIETLPQTARRQLHVSLDHRSLPNDPVEAYIEALAVANNLSAKLVGEGLIANNLAARLDGVRLDALFAKVLFLFLGLPGAVVAALLTTAIVYSGSDRRRHEIGLLQIRGSSPARSLAYVGAEAMTVGTGGALVGLAAAWLSGPFFLPVTTAASSWRWFAAAAVCGVAAALLIFFVPAISAVRRTASENVASVEDYSVTSAWKRIGLDLVLIVLAVVAFWQSSASGYQVVTAPEGVATAVVDYKAYITPGLLWIGLILLLMRLWMAFMAHGTAALRIALLPVAWRFTGIVVSAMSRERSRIVTGVVLVALAFSFATSTAIFNSTYEQQARVDASLTNGADIAVTGVSLDPASVRLTKIASVPNVVWAEPMQHRFAYVGTDLQDLYGINPTTIGKATAMSNSYFANNDAAATLAELQSTPDGVLVSDETVTDFQLHPGDKVSLRLQGGSDKAYHAVPFTFIGVVREFPTAPSDSFLVANADYVAGATGLAGAETVLVRAAGDPAAVAQAIRAALGKESALKVTDITETSSRIGSSLVSVDLHGLTTLELTFALPMIAGAVGLVFALGAEERRRSFAILLALGAKPHQLGAFLWSEALVVYGAGMGAGLGIGIALAWVLVKLTTNVFDPPPESLAIPWSYLATLAIVGAIAVSIGVGLQLRKRAEPLSFAIRRL